ncbi:MAG: DUF3047 domain-containing protein [Xanthomonadaceae bacterium]|nr:DUF3047 domain-containing protein [Xanthomonadaceae bacterium]
MTPVAALSNAALRRSPTVLRSTLALLAIFAVALLAVAPPTAEAAKRRPHASDRPSPRPSEPAPPSIARPTPFSIGPLGATAPAGWSVQALQKAEHKTQYDLVATDSGIVLRARADGAAATLRHNVFVDPALTPILHWRWRTQRMLQSADIGRKDVDDAVARVCVLFDRDPEKLTLKERALLKVDRARYGKDMPAATLCYVWDNRRPVGTVLDSARTPFVALIVASSGEADAGQWVRHRRDIAEDYRLAFRTDPPRIAAVTVEVDTDDTGESATSHFGDIFFVGRSAQ